MLTRSLIGVCRTLDARPVPTGWRRKSSVRLVGRRFPEKEVSDEMSETLTEILNLHANDGESLKSWISRASELFDKCARKTNVTG